MNDREVTFGIHPDDLCRIMDQQQRATEALERIADRLDSWTSSYEDSYNRGSEIHRLNVRSGK